MALERPDVTATGTRQATAGVVVRDATDDDMGRLAGIYAHHVLHGRASFEEVPPDVTELRRRRQATLDQGLPYLVAELGGELGGFAYAGAFRPRSAYRFTIEDSVYVAHGMAGRGIGSALLSELLERCEAGPWRQIVAVIGGGAPESIALHAKHGFVEAARLKDVGFKLGDWADVVIMQRQLGPGGSLPPTGPERTAPV